MEENPGLVLLTKGGKVGGTKYKDVPFVRNFPTDGQAHVVVNGKWSKLVDHLQHLHIDVKASELTSIETDILYFITEDGESKYGSFKKGDVLYSLDGKTLSNLKSGHKFLGVLDPSTPYQEDSHFIVNKKGNGFDIGDKVYFKDGQVHIDRKPIDSFKALKTIDKSFLYYDKGWKMLDVQAVKSLLGLDRSLKDVKPLSSVALASTLGDQCLANAMTVLNDANVMSQPSTTVEGTTFSVLSPAKDRHIMIQDKKVKIKKDVAKHFLLYDGMWRKFK